MSEKGKITLQDLKKWPDKADISDAIQEIHEHFCQEKYEFHRWNRRLKKLQELFYDMKSIKSSNKSLLKSLSSTIYQKQTSLSGTSSPLPSSSLNRISFSVPVSPRLTSPSNVPSPINENAMNESMNTSNDKLSYQIHCNTDIEEAFLPLNGRESTLLPPASTVAQCVKQVLYILQDKQNSRFNKDDKSESDESSNVRISSSSSTTTATAAISVTNPSPANNTKIQQLQNPFSSHTDKLLQLIPTLKKNVYWKQDDIPTNSPLEKSTIPFSDNNNDEDDDDDGDEDDENNNNAEVEENNKVIYRQGSKKKISKENNSKKESSQSWFTKYQNILNEDLFIDNETNNNNNNNNNKNNVNNLTSTSSPVSPSPLSKIPLSFPPLSNKTPLSTQHQTIESFPLISNPNPSSSSSSSILSTSTTSKTPKNKKDPLHNSKKKLTTSSSEIILPHKFKHMHKGISMSKL